MNKPRHELLDRPHNRCYGRVGNCANAPEYVWVGSHGGEYDLCGRCCAEWREQAQGIPAVEPVRIVSIGESGGGARPDT